MGLVGGEAIGMVYFMTIILLGTVLALIALHARREQRAKEKMERRSIPMSMQAVTQILERALSDPAFREQLKTNFDATIKGYDLTDSEKAALKKGDDATLRAMGVEERLSKPFGYYR